MTPEGKVTFDAQRAEALSWVKVGAADLAADIIAMVGDGADESEIRARGKIAMAEATIHSCKDSDITP